jgi:hypothetical protein
VSTVLVEGDEPGEAVGDEDYEDAVDLLRAEGDMEDQDVEKELEDVLEVVQDGEARGVVVLHCFHSKDLDKG